MIQEITAILRSDLHEDPYLVLQKRTHLKDLNMKKRKNFFEFFLLNSQSLCNLAQANQQAQVPFYNYHYFCFQVVKNKIKIIFYFLKTILKLSNQSRKIIIIIIIFFRTSKVILFSFKSGLQ